MQLRQSSVVLKRDMSKKALKISKYILCLKDSSNVFHSNAKISNKAPRTPAAPPNTPVLPAAAPVDTTRDAEADSVTPALWISPSAAALVNVGTVLTQDLLMLRLSVGIADPVDDIDDDADGYTVSVPDSVIESREDGAIMLGEVVN